MRRFLVLAVTIGLALALPRFAFAGVLAQIDLSSQRMVVYVNGKPRHTWESIDGPARLPDPDRHLQADQSRPVSPLHDL